MTDWHSLYKLTVAERDAAWAEVERLRKAVTYLGNRIAQLRGISGDDAALGSQPEGSQVAPGADDNRKYLDLQPEEGGAS
jgi:hypothetical protein